MKLGAERKKVIILGVLLVVAAVLIYTQLFSGSSEPAPARRTTATSAAPVVQPAAVERVNGAERRRLNRNSLGEFKPVVGSARPEDRPDPATIDPTIRFDLLAKLESIRPEVSGRNIFQTGAAPAAPDEKKPTPALPKTTAPIAIKNQPPGGPAAGPEAPAAPKISFHYYGFKVEKASGHKEAFLLDGPDHSLRAEQLSESLEQANRARQELERFAGPRATLSLLLDALADGSSAAPDPALDATRDARRGHLFRALEAPWFS